MQPTQGGNTMVENNDSSNGGLQYIENTETIQMTKEEIAAKISMPNLDLTLDDIDIMM